MAAFYFADSSVHDVTSTDQIVGVLTQAYAKEHLDLKSQQTQSWTATIEIIKSMFYEVAMPIPDSSGWGILYEYKIPRRAKRIDVVILAKSVIFVVEVNNGENAYKTADIAQVEDYCLDLQDFHHESRDRTIVPILLCTEAPAVENQYVHAIDLVQAVLLANQDTLSEVVRKAWKQYEHGGQPIRLDEWNSSAYSPTPTIIEAAQTLYAGQSVVEISRNEAGAENLSQTTVAVIDAIKEAQLTNSKVICFITGVPGAGKTLAGLNIVHNREFQSSKGELGVFLSGNSPLVKVLSEALARDSVVRQKCSLDEARRQVATFIHNVHVFIDEYYSDTSKLPVDRVLIYDEAQRAWTQEHKAKKSHNTINESEPEILLSIMDRFPDWGAVIALVGGGQEINTGEAGLREWGRAIETRFSDWKVYVSPELKAGDHSTGNMTLFEIEPSEVKVYEVPDLHLSVSIRSYRAQELSKWVALVLDGKYDAAKDLMGSELVNYPMVLTRDIEVVKQWLRRRMRGRRRAGLVASSGGRRLKALGYDPYYGLRGNSNQNELGAWYLNATDDVRSSNFLEIVATEYAVQGLELDWTGVLWDSDLRRENGAWSFKQFRGTSWESVADAQKRQFILNKYRVLLTRAREGMVVLVPHGDRADQTRLPSYYDETYDYLQSCGLEVI